MEHHGIAVGVSVDRLHIPETFKKIYKKFFFSLHEFTQNKEKIVFYFHFFLIFHTKKSKMEHHGTQWKTNGTNPVSLPLTFFKCLLEFSCLFKA